jgi:hypothetical protein
MTWTLAPKPILALFATLRGGEPGRSLAGKFSEANLDSFGDSPSPGRLLPKICIQLRPSSEPY